LDLIRIDGADLDDLRYFVRYVNENGMRIEEVNDVLYYLGDKYDFDPMEYKINLLTGIVAPKIRSVESPAPREAPATPRSPEPPKPVERVEDVSQPAYPDRKRVEIQDSSDGIRTYKIFAYGGAAEEQEQAAADPNDYTSELEEWITGNNLSYLEARRMIASLELKKRMGELYPHVDRTQPSGKLSEFEDWISLRRLNYFKVRMMIAELGQEEERERMEAAVA
jgi:hypothetical protein